MIIKDIFEDDELIGITWDDVTCNIHYPEGYSDKILKKHPNAKEIRKSGVPMYDTLTLIFWDSGTKDLNARSSDKAPSTDDDEEERLKNRELCDVFKPFHDMDFVDEDTDWEYEVQLPTAMEIESSKGKIPAELSKSKDLQRKL
ncbi:hypothetical protein M9H77_21925 [Catharanthus roseus]|uniref:Uncharacterized protein n=1 Tax=Catharanthus roseus TaxID=4058 RepID=A0ACC0AQ82_CATRO|nr:hypothetical protein M9H77_21925 [Catharanthus roseus]